MVKNIFKDSFDDKLLGKQTSIILLSPLEKSKPEDLGDLVDVMEKDKDIQDIRDKIYAQEKIGESNLNHIVKLLSGSYWKGKNMNIFVQAVGRCSCSPKERILVTIPLDRYLIKEMELGDHSLTQAIQIRCGNRKCKQEYAKVVATYIDYRPVNRNKTFPVKILTRVKSLGSGLKAVRKLLSGETVDDLYTINIITESKEQCYQIEADFFRGQLKDKFHIFEESLDDYIKEPKPNGYQSIHMDVKYPKTSTTGIKYQIQVKSLLMEQNAKDGSAAHPTYKEEQILIVKDMLAQKIAGVDSFSDFDNRAKLEKIKSRLPFDINKARIIKTNIDKYINFVDGNLFFHYELPQKT